MVKRRKAVASTPIVNLNLRARNFPNPFSLRGSWGNHELFGRPADAKREPNTVSLQIFIANGSPIPITTRYRCLNLIEQLQALGYRTEYAADWFDEANIPIATPVDFDALILYRLMMSPRVERLIASAHRLGKPVIFDTDDLIFEGDLIEAHRGVKILSEEDQKLYAKGVDRYLLTLQACDAVTASTPVLANLARRRGKKALVHRNSLGNEMLALANTLHEQRARRDDGKTVIGYGSGTHTHDVDFAEVDGALVHLLDHYPNLELWIAGPLTISENLKKFGKRVRRFPLTDWRGWFELASQVDIALAPLERDNIFCRAKSEIKFVESAALGVPIVASDIDPYRDSITHAKDGFLAANQKDWIAALSQLIEDPVLRSGLARRARATILQRYTPAARAADLAVILPRLLDPPIISFRSSGTEDDVPLLINWLVPEPFPGAGGDIGLFRVIRHFAEFGHECNVYVVHYNLINHWSTEQLRFYVRKHFGPTRAHYYRWSGKIGDADCTFATFWPTVENLLPQPNGGKRYYLVQDYEPVFYPDHEEHRTRAENTYRAGLRCITLGPWVAKMLRERHGVQADHFDFSIDERIYRPNPALRRPGQRVCFYARPSTVRRCYDIGIEALRLVKARMPQVEIALFGSSEELSPAPPAEFINYGMLSHRELASLFSSSDVGLVFSLTNPSFVPLEMMACGCAVVELATERFDGILTHGKDAWLVDLDPQLVGDAICQLLTDDALRESIVENGCRRTRTMSWRNSIRQIEAILLRDIPPHERLLRPREIAFHQLA
jgi:glycosyltransferase involved in cell wall biosynthesis